MRKLGGLIAILFILLFAFTTIAQADEGDNDLIGINDLGQIVGDYANATGEHGFLDSGGIFTTIDFPSATISGTWMGGINNLGQITGEYADATGTHGFLYSGGVFTTIDYPNAIATGLSGLNDLGQIAGSYNAGAGPVSFVDSGGIFTAPIIDPLGSFGADGTYVLGINDSGQLSGYYLTGTYGTGIATFHGFVDSGGIFTSLDDPAPSNRGVTIAEGINNLGQVTGNYDTPNLSVGFVYSDGTFSDLIDPSASGPGGTYPVGINDLGQIVGSYTNATGRHGFLDSDGTFTAIDDPNSFFTPPVYYTPEPCSLLLLLFGMAGLAGLRIRKGYSHSS